MPKCHPLFFACMNDFKMVFREPSDMGRNRKAKTPEPAQIMEVFVCKWRNAEQNGVKIIKDKVMKELNALKIHIQRAYRGGCLSHIEPGVGTNRNEALHRYINPHFTQSRIGIQLAFALLTVLLHQYSEVTVCPWSRRFHNLQLFLERQNNHSTKWAFYPNQVEVFQTIGWFCRQRAWKNN